MTAHRCPQCGWIISDVEKQAALYDYACPRCLMKRFSEFEPMEVMLNEPAGNSPAA